MDYQPTIQLAFIEATQRKPLIIERGDTVHAYVGNNQYKSTIAKDTNMLSYYTLGFAFTSMVMFVLAYALMAQPLAYVGVVLGFACAVSGLLDVLRASGVATR